MLNTSTIKESEQLDDEFKPVFVFVFFFSLEPLFFQYGVDIIIEAHEHSYERLWPVFNDIVTAHNYSNPKAPVHLISGSAGCNEAYGICVSPMLGPRGMQYFISF